MTAPSLAFQVDAEEQSVIVYAKSNAQARREGACEMNTDWDYVTCRRAPHYDALAPRGPTREQLFDDGWWFECSACGSHVAVAGDGVCRDGEFLCGVHADPYRWLKPLEPWASWNPYIWVGAIE